jgi:serine/threonine-protein kinase
VIGTIAGSYRIVSKIAEGGMGAVYRAEHTMIGRPVAVKVLLPELSHQTDVITRFFNEARAATAVRHPGIVEIFDFGYMPSGQAYIVMELLEGEPVGVRLRRLGKLGEAEAAKIIRGTALALGAAHGRGIVHRDLKPDNLFICPDPGVPGGEVSKLLDFGIAKLGHGAAAKGVTRIGTVLGTPTYMSPEQCTGASDVDGRADLYSLGCIFYELVTGRPPFLSTQFVELISLHLMEMPESPRALVPGLSAACDAIIMRLLAKEPKQRYANGDELAAEVERLLQPAAPVAWQNSPVGGAFDQAPTTLSAPPQWARAPAMPAASPEPPMRGPTAGAMPAMSSPHLTPPPGSYPTPPPSSLRAASVVAGAPARERRGLVIGIVAVLMVAAVVVIVLLTSGSGSTPAPGPTDPTTPSTPTAPSTP